MNHSTYRTTGRSFLRSIGLGVTALACGLFVQASSGTVSKPNVLFIICDDLNDWVLHPSGHPKVKTPNMDRLRNRSINFSNAHVVVPVCGPSRKCLFSGLYPQTMDNYGFDSWDKTKGLQGCVPLPLHFRDNGYAVYGTGKLLHRGAEGDFYTQYGIGPDYGPWPWEGRGVENSPHSSQFETWRKHLPVGMHRDLNYGPLSDVPNWETGSVKGIPGKKGWYYQNKKPFRYVDADDRDLIPDEISADWAVDILKKKHDRPFYLGVGFIRPHTPLYAPKKYFDMYPLEEITLPPYKKDDLADCASILRKRWQWGYKKYEALIAAGGEKAWKEWVQAYSACITFVDDQIGEVLDALESSPYRDNTVIVLTGDNGYHVGEKDCIQKWHLWDESTRVPLFVHVPGAQGNGQTCDRPVSQIDMYPTLVDLCGLPREPNKGGSNISLDGHSLRALIDNPDSEQWHGPTVAFMAIRDWKTKFSAAGDKYDPHFSVRSRRYRYTLCGNGEEELYDHLEDPNEWDNLADNPGHAETKKQMRGELMKILRTSRMPIGLESKRDRLYFNDPGWSQSGGLWIKPEQSMRRVIWNEVSSDGGAFKQNNAHQSVNNVAG